MKTILSNLKLELKNNVSGHCVRLQPGCFVFYNNAKKLFGRQTESPYCDTKGVKTENREIKNME